MRRALIAIKAVTRHSYIMVQCQTNGEQRRREKLFPFAFLSSDTKLQCVAMATSSDVLRWRLTVRRTASSSALYARNVGSNPFYTLNEICVMTHIPVRYLCLVRVIIFVKPNVSLVDNYKKGFAVHDQLNL
jgi:hypothetical protein